MHVHLCATANISNESFRMKLLLGCFTSVNDFFCKYVLLGLKNV